MKSITMHKKVLPSISTFAANHNHIHTSYGAYFTSYDSVILFNPTDESVTYLDPKWEFSRTTTKHLGKYLDMSPTEIRKGIESGDFIVKDLSC